MFTIPWNREAGPAKIVTWPPPWREIDELDPGESMFRFKCTSRHEWHEGMPTFGAEAPLYFYSIPTEERGSRCIPKEPLLIGWPQFTPFTSNVRPGSAFPKFES